MTTSIDYSNTYTATLLRQQPTDPWGVRIRGGTDTGDPPTVYQVRKKSPASKAGVKEGDFLTLIDDTTTEALTHQQITDMLNTTTLTLQFTLARNLQPGVNGQTYNDDVTTTTTQTADDFYNVQPAQIEFTRVRAALDGSKKREAIYRLAHRVEAPQTQVKSYQPYNMLGQSSAVSQQSAHRHVYQVPVASVVQQETLPAHIMWTPPSASTSATAAAAAVLSANLSDACNLDYANNNNGSFANDVGQYSVDLIPPTVLPNLPRPSSTTGKKRQKRYEDSDLCNFEPNYGPPRQSRSFMLIETALEMQGAGETALPPPRSATMEQQRWEDQHRYYPPETFEHYTSEF